ncbi:MAG: tetratricopeptide repeat protein [Gallionella sp.]|nr:tetratricopeptide repeat protein [Gallionella sp.]MDD4957904.1 tetratricopeptide repeat protein [Gallionella sp.]
MTKLNYLIISSLLLSACAHTPPKPVIEAVPVQETTPPVAVEPPPPPEPPLPNVNLSEDLLYEILISEVAQQRGYGDLALEGMTDAASQTRDPRLARRAAQFALESGNTQRGIAAFRLWEQLEPTSVVPARLLSSTLLRGGKIEESTIAFSKVLAQDSAHADQIFLQIEPLALAYPDKAAGLKLMQTLAQPYPQLAEAHWSVAQLARAAGDMTLALSSTQQARTLRPDWSRPVILEAELRQKQSPQAGLDVLREYLKQYPKARDVRILYARLLLDQKQYPLARAEFQQLAAEVPDNAELAFAIALISLQMNDLKGAEAQLKQALTAGNKDPSTVHYYLAQLSEANKTPDEAIAHYREVKDGEYAFNAQMRIAYLLSKQNKVTEAREHLHQIKPDSNQQRVQILLVEAQLLRQAKQVAEAHQILSQQLAKLPNDPDLLYETAMLADTLGKYEESEKHLRKLILLQPKRAHAYNALGYSLLDRNLRIPEAMALVEKANKLAPDDIAIMDSMGWGYYRSGKLEESIKWLKRAFAGNPDPEIASHLGEVLWTHGEKEEAQKIWQDSLKTNPDNALLQTVIKKFIP